MSENLVTFGISTDGDGGTGFATRISNNLKK